MSSKLQHDTEPALIHSNPVPVELKTCPAVPIPLKAVMVVGCTVPVTKKLEKIE